MLAHGIGERGDLPLPLYAFSWGLGLAIVLSFVLFGVAWTEPKLRQAATGRGLVPAAMARPLRLGMAAIGFAFYLGCLYAAFAGTDDRALNILPVTFYVVVWVGMQLVAGLFGDLWAALNPIDTLARLSERIGRLVGRTPTAGPSGLGHWPAVGGMLIFLFYELSHPDGAGPRTLGRLLLVHAVVTVVAGFLWGAAWVRFNEPFTVFFDRIGAMAPIFARQGGLGIRPPVAGLATTPIITGTVALFLVVIGGTSFDGFSESQLGRDVFGGRTGWELAWVELIGLLASIALVSGLYAVGVWWTTRVNTIGFVESWRAFGPSLIPIAFGYGVAHYFQLLSDEIQSWFFRLSDPLGQGWDLFGGADGLVWRIDPDVVAWVQVAAILVGHVGAVMVAHDRAVDIFPVGKSLQSQFAMLFVMVAYSTLGLWLLLSA